MSSRSSGERGDWEGTYGIQRGTTVPVEPVWVDGGLFGWMGVVLVLVWMILFGVVWMILFRLW